MDFTVLRFNKRIELLLAIGALLCFTLFCINGKLYAQNHNSVLWYNYPAEDWKTQALHLGNGYMGASFYGGVEEERMDITEETMWFGGPGQNPAYNFGIIPEAGKSLEEIRNAIVKGEIPKADSLVSKYFVGDYSDFGSLSSIGQLYFRFDLEKDEISDYKRSLDVSKSLGTVSYHIGGEKYQREYFASYPDRVLVFHFEGGDKGQISFEIGHEFTQKKNQIRLTGDEIHVQGQIDGNQQEYHVIIKVLQEGGRLVQKGDFFEVVGARNATVLYTAATSYIPEMPYSGADPKDITQSVIQKAARKGYSRLKQDHIQDYSQLYNRVSLEMEGDALLEQLPTNERYEMLKTGMTDDAGLKVLLFNLGRYLLISASRSTTFPSGLQGLWVPGRTAAWNGNFQSNINLQEMYWTVGPLNLPEIHESYINWIKTLVEPGRKVAKAYYGSEGWVSHTTGNIWGYTSPGADMLWGMYPSGSAWHCQHLWSQYEFTQDKEYLLDEAYPIMKEAAQFYLANLVPYEGKYIIAPTVSAEHGVDFRDGMPVKYALTNGEAREGKWFNLPGAYQDVQMVYDLFSNVMAAGRVLGIDADFINEVKSKRDQLLPLRVGKYGQIQEWAWDMDNPRDHHRHIAHMYALMPGRQIDPYKTPELAKAAEVSLNMRGHTLYGPKWPHMGGNWNKTWRIWCFARLGDGEKAARIFNDMVTDVGFENLMAHESGNMQVDGSMSTPGFMAEMLMQSHQGEIHLLPALPLEWPEGKVSGLIARGGYKVDISWEYGKLKQCNIKSLSGNPIPPIRLSGELINPSKEIRVNLIP